MKIEISKALLEETSDDSIKQNEIMIRKGKGKFREK